MNDWVEINLPWHSSKEDRGPPYEEYPDFSEKIEEIFGSEYKELKGMFESWGHPHNDEFWKIKCELQDSGVEDWRAALKALNNPRVNMVLQWHDLNRQVSDWHISQPEVLEIEQRNLLIYTAYKKWQGIVSFKHNELCREGVLIECKDTNGNVFQLLIGGINESGGIGAGDRGIDDDTIIKRCRVVWSKEKGKELSHE
jgi:hypothetical protein